MTIDILWVLFCAVLVLIMQGGFLFLESGLTRKKNAINVALKNAADFALTFLMWWFISYGIMFGTSYQGLIGTSQFGFEVSTEYPYEASFFIFQAMFCATAATIVSGAIAERTKYVAYKLITLLIVGVIYPVFGHWAWAGFNQSQTGYLAQAGFIDFAGSTVVHSVGGWVALAAIIIIGPRIGRFSSEQSFAIPFSNLPAAMLGIVLFIVGWVGFNAGSTLAFSSNIPMIIINTLLAACAGGLGAYLITLFWTSSHLEKSVVLLNGILSGLVAITASCHAVNQLQAIIIGIGGSLFMILGVNLLAKLKLDDAISAIPVHLFAGIWGTLAVALFGDLSLLNTGLSRTEQFLVQLEGIISCALWSFSLSYLVLYIINHFYPLRVSKIDEHNGLNIAEHNARNDLHDFLVNLKKQESNLAHRIPVEPFTEVGLIAEKYNQMMDVIEQNSAKTQSIVRDIQAGVVTLDAAQHIVSMNPAAEAIFSINESEALGRRISDIFTIDHVSEFNSGNELPFIGDFNQLFIKPSHLRFEGQPYQQLKTKFLDIVITQSSHSIIEHTCLINDMTEYKAIEAALHAEKEQMHATLDSIGDGVITTTASGNIVYMNPIAESLIGWPLAKAKKRKIYQVMAVVDSPEQRPNDAIIRSVIENKQTHVTNKPRLLYCRDGSVRAIRHTIAPMFDQNNNVNGTVVVFQDVTQSQIIQRQLNHQAKHDGLTGLINRTEFDRCLAELVEDSIHTKQSHILLYIDLDRFKIVNDLCGHQAGDELLRQVAHYMKQKIRSSDILARLGGDEFAAILYHCDIEKGQKVAENIRDKIESYRFNWEGKEFTVTTSIGVIPIDQYSNSVNDIIQLADAACYASKDLGRNNVYLYQPDDKEINARKSQVKWVSRINQALEQDKFKLYFQQIAPVNSLEKSLKFEVLLRMHLDDEIYMPGAFIPTAERYNLMHSIDQWVIKNSFKWLSENKGKLPKQLTCSINLSGESINKPELKNFIMAMLDKYSIDGGHIVFEITETIAISNLHKASDVMEQLRKVGIRFALDDFGSGLSSFGYLKSLPIDYLKIDGSFVKDINNNTFDQAMVDAINKIGHTMGLKTIVEYVSNAQVKSTLESIKVDYLQGYYIHKPSPIDNLLKDFGLVRLVS
ncbi:ammonium transporter [Catenovulum sp. 2E275]|uniref:ammonium transporter n=1 Tax=Catenovulum sp. 2E275 TaxID=2980497 RepID=UPI0021D19416|nr:ammonium transporter [Catenovulum sp. 2E275]MCU4674551.1 ammonium transporter [Catenovulum sp. 2E275]